ncbi:hypothetical protein BSKO_04297 [Bryopsis sp. KO-2023]|nr:hypothetical protein BSKO_04297 [Bryopsis sp. KO-2023]
MAAEETGADARMLISRVQKVFPLMLPDGDEIGFEEAWAILEREIKVSHERARTLLEQEQRLDELEKHTNHLEDICTSLQQVVSMHLPNALEIDIKSTSASERISSSPSDDGLGETASSQRVPGKERPDDQPSEKSDHGSCTAKSDFVQATDDAPKVEERIQQLLLSQQKELQDMYSIAKDALRIATTSCTNATDESGRRAEHWQHEADWLRRRNQELADQNCRLVEIVHGIGTAALQGEKDGKKIGHEQIANIALVGLEELDHLKEVVDGKAPCEEPEIEGSEDSSLIAVCDDVQETQESSDTLTQSESGLSSGSL